MQAEADVHDTAFRKLNCAPDGLGVRWIRQAVPFQCSAKVPEFELPTAVHAEADTHATLAKKPPPAEGLGVAWMRHRVPFQCSAKVPEFELPTAVHAEADAHATLAKKPPPAEGLGVAWMRHRVPFQCSAKVPEFELPTAVHAEDEVQATPNRAPFPTGGLGVAWMRHWVPFHRSARGVEAPWLLTAWPTAVHADGDEQDTPNKRLSFAFRGLGVAWMAHLRPSQCSARVTATPEPRMKFPTAVQEDELGQETPASWPVRAKEFCVWTIDHPGIGPLENAAGTAFTEAAAPTAGPSNTTTAPTATVIRRIRPRIATPHYLPDGMPQTGAG